MGLALQGELNKYLLKEWKSECCLLQQKKKKMVSNNFKKLLELKEIAIRKNEQICKEWKTVKG